MQLIYDSDETCLFKVLFGEGAMEGSDKNVYQRSFRELELDTLSCMVI